VILGSSQEGRPFVVAALSQELVQHGLNAVELVKFMGGFLGGGGGGRPTLAQAGGKDASKLDEALDRVMNWIHGKI